MLDSNTIVFSENAYVPDDNQKLPFYMRYQAIIYIPIIILLVALISLNWQYTSIIFVLSLVVIQFVLYKNLSPDKMKIDSSKISLSFKKDYLVLERERFYVTATVSRKERYTFNYNDLKEFKYNKNNNELILDGNATIEYIGYHKDKLDKKSALKHEAPCFFAIYAKDIDTKSFKAKLAKLCPYPIDFTNTLSKSYNEFA